MDSGARNNREWDVALSFAGEQRGYVEQVAESLKKHGVRVFYDNFEKVNLWGKNLYEHLDYIYRKAATYAVVFLSADYAKKVWTTHERRSAQARAFEENTEYILPVRVDGSEVPGFLPTVGYIDIASVSPDELALLIVQKIGPIHRKDYLPPNPIALFEILEADSEDDRNAIISISNAFMQSLRRMTTEERDLIAEIMGVGCTEELPDNVHVSLDLIRRDIGMAPAEVLETLRSLSSVGVRVTTAEVQSDEEGIDDEDSGHEASDLIAIQWDDTTYYDDEHVMGYAVERSTEVAWAMLTLGGSYCLDHGRDAIKRLDFSALASDSA
ncbi:hypothetical protein AWB85_20085 [Mycobacteroides immunogenum]|uniref:TIR domain-containing protein n=1 Tax=Mycobacteroides immunogenum TaxID=83262 RepID=A0A179VCS7_9MYCO|nr:TIR domain-containing protein [Mycobacteroides immunogenum]OAT69690.1 hypothetical protein AWB85_20085 [Mycobacteroides immunogenum]